MREALLLAAGRLVCTFPWFIICCVPFYPLRRVGVRVMAAVITGASMLFFFFNFFFRLYDGNYATYAIPVFSLLYIAMTGFYIWGFQVSAVKLLYVFFLVQAVSTAVNYTAAMLLKPFFKEERISLQRTPAYIGVIFLLTVLLYPLMWHFCTHQLREAMDKLRNRDFRLLCIPPVLIFMITQIFSDMSANPDIPQGQAIAIFLLVSATGLVTYFLNVRLALDTARRIRLETEMEAMERQIMLQSQSYATLTGNIEAARAARHDLRHHLTAMSSYADKGDFQGLTAYLAQYKKSLPEENELQVCGNYAVDMVVRYYLLQARENGAQTDVKLDLPPRPGIPDTDLTVIFGNIFENAAQSVSGQDGGRRYIRARCGIEQGKLVLTVDNSLDTSGKRAGSPGIGQSSVKAVAQKYHGTARFEQLEGIYRASVLLNIPDRGE